VGENNVSGIQPKILAQKIRPHTSLNQEFCPEVNNNVPEINPFRYVRNKNEGQKLRVD